MSAVALPRLLLVSDREAARGRPLVEVVVAVAEVLGGEVLVQLREKEMAEAELRALAAALRDGLPAGALLVVNDRAEIARELGIGLHLPAVAASVGGRPALLGRSVHNLAEAATAIGDGADYAVVGTIFATGSKPGYAGDGLGHLGALSDRLAPMPVYAIGGIEARNAGAAIGAGAHGVAVRSAILGAEDPAGAAREIAAVIAGRLRG